MMLACSACPNQPRATSVSNTMRVTNLSVVAGTRTGFVVDTASCKPVAECIDYAEYVAIRKQLRDARNAIIKAEHAQFDETAYQCCKGGV